MDDPVHYLLHLQPGEELDAFFDVSEGIYAQKLDGNELARFLVGALSERSSQPVVAEANSSKLRDEVLLRVTALLSHDPARSIQVLTTKLHDFENRALAATMLGWFGVAARSALPALVDLASFMNNATWEARRAVLRIGSAESEVLRQFEEALTRGDDGAVRNLFTLGIHLGMQQVPTFQALVRSAAKSPSVHMRDAATDMIASLNPTRRKAYLRVLRQLAEDTDPGIRAAAAEALAEVLPTA